MKQTLLLLLTFAGLSSFSQSGAPDPNFGSGGKVITPVADGTEDYGSAMLVQPDGKIVVLGASNFSFAVLRYKADGSLDDNFGDHGKAVVNVGDEDSPSALARQTDGKIVVVGSTVNSSTGSHDIVVLRYKADGTPDDGFGDHGKVITDINGNEEFAYAVAIQPDGKILVAGSEGNSNIYDFLTVRYKADGSLDDGFGDHGAVISDFDSEDENIYSLVVQPDGKILAAGNAYHEETGYDLAMLRYSDNGSLDKNFGNNGEATTNLGSDREQIQSISLQSDKKIVGTGYISSAGENNDIVVLRYSDNGSLDDGFGNHGKIIADLGGDDDEAWDTEIQPDGKILVGGFNGNTSEGTSDFVLLRYKVDGSPDNNFGTGGKAIVDFGGIDQAYGMGLYGTRIYVAGVTNVNGSADFALAAVQNDVAAPLPLSLTSFAASKQSSKVQLNWTTVNEQNISSFEVIRSGDGRSFSSIGSVKAVGNSSANESYTFTDAQPLVGTNHYRLKILEAGGKTIYSAIVTVTMNAFAGLQMFPNPVRNTLNVQFTATAAKPLQIRDATGRVVKTVSVSQIGNITIPVDVSSLQKGIYYLQAEGETMRFVKE